MRIDEVKAALLPSVANIDELFTAFVAEHRSEDTDRFLVHLVQTGVLSHAQLEQLRNSDPTASGTLSFVPEAKQGMVGQTMTTELAEDEDDEQFTRWAQVTPQPAAPRDRTAAAAPIDPAPETTAGPPPPPPGVRTANPAPGRESEPVRRTGPQPSPNATWFAAPPVVENQTPAPAGPRRTDPNVEVDTEVKAAAPAGEPKPPPPAAITAKGGAVADRTGPRPNPKERLEKLKQRTPSYPPPAGDVTKQGAIGAPPDVPGRGYKFVGKIGEGAMGEVLIAKDNDLHRTVAYKVMSEAIAEQPPLASKFYGEAQITAQLDHPNIVPVYSLDRAPNGTLAYTMKYIRGKTFEKIVDECKEQYKARKIDEKHSLTTRLEQFLKVCDAMHYAHSRGVVHRDLKPENIMLGAYGEVYVMDWGIARLFEIEGAKRDELVLVEGYQENEKLAAGEVAEDDDDEGGVVIGTPQYMSPEQAHGKKDLDGRSDQYSMGLILYELVALKPAVTGKSPIKIVMRQQDADKDPMLHAFGEAIPPELKAIVEKATQKKPDHRYASVEALGDDIRRYLHGDAVLARPDTPRQAVMRWIGKHREMTLLAVFALITTSGFALSATIGYTLYAQSQARQHEQQLMQLVTSTGAQAALIDSYFARYEGLLGIVSASATEMLIRGEPTTDKIHFEADFMSEDPARRPADLRDSKRYRQKISIEHPRYSMEKNAKEFEVMPMFQRLTPLQRYLKRVMLLSHSEEASSRTPAQADRLVRDIGTPVVWTSIGLETGGMIRYPGHAVETEEFGRNRTPWYKQAHNHREATWGEPYIDTGGQGLVLPCVIPLYDDQDKPKLLGVAAIELTFDYIIEKLLVPEDLPAGIESFLVDDRGRIVIRSSEKGKLVGSDAAVKTRRMPDFEVPEVFQAITEGESGKFELWEDGRNDLILYNRMNSMGWYYVVRGPEDALLSD